MHNAGRAGFYLVIMRSNFGSGFGLLRICVVVLGFRVRDKLWELLEISSVFSSRDENSVANWMSSYIFLPTR